MRRVLNVGLFFAFQIGYLEWPNHARFIIQFEYELFSNTQRLLSNLTHPLILVGFVAQMMLLLGIFLKNFNKKINAFSIILLGLIVLLFMIVGCTSANIKIVLSTLPYLVLSSIYFFKIK